MEKRMNYLNTCIECGWSFEGFEEQTTCWNCILEWIKRNFYRKD